MLRFVMGAAGSGKTTLLAEEMAAAVRSGGKAIYLVPEQFSFEAERMLYRKLGPQLALNVEVLSFTRLCNSVFRRFGGLAGVQVTPTAKYLLMSVAVEELREELQVYRKSALNTSFLRVLVEACSELKAAGITPLGLERFVEESQESPLRDKLRELSALYSAYQSLLSRGYTDPDDDLIRACGLLENNNFFRGLHLFVDGFTTFMSGEFELLGHAIAQAEAAVFAMTADSPVDRQGGMGVFSPVQAAIARLSRLAESAGVPVEQPRPLEELPRYRSGALAHVSRYFLQPAPPAFKGDTGPVALYRAGDPWDEVEAAAAGIARLVREEGYAYRDVAVVARDAEPYLRAVEALFTRYGIPWFSDTREDVENTPLIGGVLAAVDAVRSNLDSQAVLALAKSPLLALEPTGVAALENYCYCWGVRGSVWLEPFANNPRGMAGPLTDGDRALLEQINEIRAAVTGPLPGLREAMRAGTGLSFATGIHAFLEEVHAAEHLSDYAGGLRQDLRESFLDDCAQLWDALMGILDVFGSVLARIKLSRRRLYELLRLAVSAAEVAGLPQTLDQVIVGQADRIRPGEVRAVFVLGANEGEFPLQAGGGGVFSDAERKELIDAGLGVSPPGFQQAVLERFYAYFALTLPRERLQVSWRRSDLQGREQLPSILVTGLRELFPNLEPRELSPMDRVQGRASALALLSREFAQDSPLAASLLEFLGQDREEPTRSLGAYAWGNLLGRMELASRRRNHLLEDSGVAAQLFGRRMRLSPTRVERYYRCPFSYFAADGLGLKKRRKVEFNPLESGSLIHNVLQVMVRRHGGDKLAELDPAQREQEVRELVHGYLEERIEDMDALPMRFQVLFDRLVGLLSRLLEQLGRELSQSEYRPVAFELPIGGPDREDGRVEPLVLETPDGVSVAVEGVVDRVDVMEKGGKKYVRVVDYKSGAKDFKLHDVLYGLNMQMLLYLFTVAEQGAGELADCVPAGVLYMPVRERYLSAAREDGEEKMEALRRKQWRMNGLLLEDEESLRGMERDLAGVFIPAKLDSKGRLDARSSLAGAEEMGKLSEKVRELVAGMASALGQGKISAFPVDSPDYDTCRFCDYRAVCGFEQGDPVRPIAKLNRRELFRRLAEEA